MVGILDTVMQQYLKLRMHRIENFMQHPGRAQESLLSGLIQTAQTTEFGRKHNFLEIRNAEQFAREVPVQDYESLKKDIERMMHGERDVLWPGEVNWFAKSSGTTSDKSKFIPVPPDNLKECHIQGGWDSVTLLYHNRPDAGIFKYKNLVMSGSFQHLDDYPKTRFGDVSSILISHLPAIGRMFYTPDLETTLLHDFEEKIERIAHICSKQDDVGMFGGVPTWLIVIFRRILELTGKKNLLEVWPNLRCYMHGGVGFEPYRQTFRDLIPSDDFIYQEVYNASEGYFGVQCDFSHNDMLLLADNGVFYEFVPMEEWDKSHPKTALLEDVEIGKTYAILISANNGLWRYQPGDTVQFTRKYPHCFTISGRTKQFINAFGEELMVGDAEKALADACSKTAVVVAEYTAAPIYFSGPRSGKGGHEWVVEFEKEPSDLQVFNRVLDESLQKVNSDYEAKRFKNMALEPLTLRAVPKGTFMRWMKSRGKFGNQNKVPRLANHRQFVEEILEFSEKN